MAWQTFLKSYLGFVYIFTIWIGLNIAIDPLWHLDPLLLRWFNFHLPCINNHMLNQVWDLNASQISTSASLNFGNGKVISSHKL